MLALPDFSSPYPIGPGTPKKVIGLLPADAVDSLIAEVVSKPGARSQLMGCSVLLRDGAQLGAHFARVCSMLGSPRSSRS
jgi:hypothetical protein